MSKVIITSQKLVDLADAVRTHNSISDKLKLPDIPGMIGVNLAPGTYDASGNLLKSWDQLIADGDISVNNGVLTSLTEKDIISPVESYFVSGPALTMADVDTIVIDDSVTEIGEGNYGAFEGCSNLKNIIFKGDIEAIGSRAFWGCGISSIDFIKGVNVLGDEVFCDCKNMGPNLIIPDWWLAVNYKNDGTGIFSRCTGIKNIVLPNGIQNIPRGFVSDCVNLESINMPTSIREIGLFAFMNCSGLTEITIPDGVTSIGSYAFRNCNNLTKIYYSGTATGAPWGATNATVITDF